ncbi:MAG: hypothetical protein IJ692_01915 [Alloprevotella sp.]|nr:hypothetical protein [Alloprevotella sp.]
MKHYSIGAFFSICLLVVAMAGAFEGPFELLLCAAFCFLGVSFGLLLTAWRRGGLKETVRRLLHELYFPALRWSFFFVVLHEVFAWLGLTPEHWSFKDSLQSLWDAVFMMSGHDVVLTGSMGFLRALVFGSVISVCTEKAIQGTHPAAGVQRVRIATTVVLFAAALLTWIPGLELRGLGLGLPMSCFIAGGALTSVFLPVGAAAFTAQEDAAASLWLRRAFVVLAFSPLTFALLARTGLPQGGSGFVPYSLCGIALPLAWLEGYRWLERRYGFTLSYRHLLRYDTMKRGARRAWRGLCIAAKATWRGTRKALAACCRALRAATLAVGRGVKRFVQGLRDIVSASSPDEE